LHIIILSREGFCQGGISRFYIIQIRPTSEDSVFGGRGG
jgi:hypothetical protein